MLNARKTLLANVAKRLWQRSRIETLDMAVNGKNFD